MRLDDFFSGFGRQIVSITGCGGKTSLMWALAACTKKKKTLVTTTTHTQNPNQAAELYDYFVDETAAARLEPSAGIYFAGKLGGSGASVSSLPPLLLEKIVPLFDHVFIEADGSRSKPLKAWADYEPVITESTTVTIGVLPLWPLGKIVSGDIVHRLPLFTALTGAEEGDTISLAHYLPVISGQTVDGIDMDSALNGSAHSLFSIFQGKKILFFNQVEDGRQMENAHRLVGMLPRDFRSGFCSIIAGSVRQNHVETLQ
jgi:probable selenium-dependent hydroxylase accessory protein YqeC